MPWWALGKWVNIVEKYIPVKPEGLFYNPLFVLVYVGYVTPQEAYWTARNSLNIEIYQEIACQDPVYAYWFARYVPGANIKYCQKHACYANWGDFFATDIPEADIEYCYSHLVEDDKGGIKGFVLNDL